MLKIVVVDNPTVVWHPSHEEPPQISAYTSYFRNWSYWPTFFAANSKGLPSFKFFSGLHKMHLFCKSAYQPFKVIQGQWFWYESKAHTRLPISVS